MSEIIKTEAVVLSKIDYRDSSNIAALFTKDFGKLSVIIKGGRNPKSKMGMIVDPLNYLQTIIYKKDTRDLQLLSGADIISYFRGIKDDFDKLKYSYAVVELIKNLTVEHEVNHKLFKGIIRILDLIDESNESPAILFSRFFIFFLSELGYELQLEKCSSCGRTTLENKDLSYKFEIGILCGDCGRNSIGNYPLDTELFKYLFCLKANKNPGKVETEILNKAISFLEKYLKFHISGFNGIQSFQIFKQR